MKVKPSKPLSAGAMIMLVFMLLFGIGFIVLVGGVLSENEAPLAMKFVFYLFMTGWIGTGVFMLVYHGLNLKNKKGLSLIDIETESGLPAEEMKRDPMRKLRDLESLKKDDLISEEEYKQKRHELMSEKW
ncbi:MAG TPA: hypothetical protein VLL97_01545 [Acidobacteriota bacterium]|nr:hypothetical protein [Acidobacteriota bacterium]